MKTEEREAEPGAASAGTSPQANEFRTGSVALGAVDVRPRCAPVRSRQSSAVGEHRSLLAQSHGGAGPRCSRTPGFAGARSRLRHRRSSHCSGTSGGAQTHRERFLSSNADGARTKLARGRLKSALVESDALALPFPDASLDMVTIAFGYRNLANYRAGLMEMRRVLRPGGALAILEFTSSAEPGVSRRCITGTRGMCCRPSAARFRGRRKLTSICRNRCRKFPDAPELAAMMTEEGFRSVAWEYLTFGIAALHMGRVPPL